MQQSIQSDINFERISLLYSSAQIGVQGLGLSFLTLCYAFRNLLPPNYLIVWSLLFMLVFFWRLALIFLFKKHTVNNEIDHSTIKNWEYYWIANTVAIAVVFDTIIFFPFVKDTLIALLIITMILMALSSGSAISSNSSVPVVLTFLTLTTIPLVAKTLYDGQPYYHLIAFIYSFFYLVIVRLTLHANQIAIENITLKKQNELDSLTDLLTGLWNRRRLKLFIEKLIPHSKRNQQPFSVILLDIDNFKVFNDTHGHIKGDETLVRLAECLQKQAREEDLVVRFGGEEFLIVLPDTNLSNAEKVIERIMNSIRSTMDTTISAGIAVYTPELTFEQVVKHADDALYEAKHNGRNQFIIFVEN